MGTSGNRTSPLDIEGVIKSPLRNTLLQGYFILS